jgi:hypothetical protein
VQLFHLDMINYNGEKMNSCVPDQRLLVESLLAEYGQCNMARQNETHFVMSWFFHSKLESIWNMDTHGESAIYGRKPATSYHIRYARTQVYIINSRMPTTFLLETSLPGCLHPFLHHILPRKVWVQHLTNDNMCSEISKLTRTENIMDGYNGYNGLYISSPCWAKGFKLI